MARVKITANSIAGTPSPQGSSMGGSQPWEVDLKKLAGELYEKLSEFDKKSDDRQIKAMEALGIFVALFSFISVNIQIFNRISSAWSAGFFMLLILCSLSILVILLDLLLIKPPQTNEQNRLSFLLEYRFILIGIFLFIGISSVFCLRNFPLNPLPENPELQKIVDNKVDEKLKELNGKIYQKSEVDKLLIEPKDEITDFKKCIWNNGLNNCLK